MDTLLAGVAVRDITPGPGVALWGYMDRLGPATGTLDPLYAKAVVFRAGDDAAALVSLDLGRTPLDAVRARLCERAARAGVGHVFLAATHTHHAPEMDVENAPHIDVIERLIGDAIEEAVGNLRPARLGVGRAEFDIAHNRRRLLDDGRCVMIWRNEERFPTGPVDREATLVRIEAEEGDPLALLVHYACHPVVMGPSNRQYSADYVGELCRQVKQDTGFECVFLQGAIGDINPYLDKTSVEDGAVEAMRSVGRSCANAVLAALPGIRAELPEHPSVACSETSVPVGVRWNMDDPAQRAICLMAHGGEDGLFYRYLHALRPDLTVPLTVLVLNRSLALVGMPGEIFVRYQMELKDNGPVRPTLLCGYTNGYHAYFPTVRDALAGGYGGTTASYVGIGAADRLTTEAQIEMARLMGQLERPSVIEDFMLLEPKDVAG